MLCGWEGNRRSGVALAMRHNLADSVVYPPLGSKANVREMSTPPTLHWSAPLKHGPFYLFSRAASLCMTIERPVECRLPCVLFVAFCLSFNLATAVLW